MRAEHGEGHDATDGGDSGGVAAAASVAPTTDKPRARLDWSGLLKIAGWLTITASRGYASVSHARAIAALADSRPTIGLYIGDYDPTGLDIDRALGQRLPFPLERIALNADQVAEHNLPPVFAKVTDSRSAAMAASHGSAVQVELDALPSDVLFDVVDRALAEHAGVIVRPDGKPDWPDIDALEREQRQWLRDLAASAGEDR